MSKATDVIEKPVTAERAVVRIGPEQTGGELLAVDLYNRAAGAVIAEYRHPETQERTLKIIRNSRSTMTYVGLAVEVIVRMENCSWIRYRGREFVVSTDDLRKLEDREPTALAT